MRARLMCAALAAAAGAMLLAQEQRPTFRTEANYVRVDMYVTQGNQSVNDLRLDEIKVFEDGAPQKITAFEHVLVRPAGPQEFRREPTSVRESESMAADPRARIIVTFLDTFHVRVDGSHRIQESLRHLFEQAIGDDDLVALMHPRMSARDITLGRKTVVISELLKRQWTWGEKRRDTPDDPVEQQWFECYGESRYYREMRARRREAMALDALEDLVVHLRGLREERKAVLVVTEGWRLFERDDTLASTTESGRVPGKPEIFVQKGKPATRDPQNAMTSSMYDCDAARIRLASMDNSRRVRDLIGAANRANVAFYPVDPRGLALSDSDLVTDVSPAQTRAGMQTLSTQLNQLRELASNTDGLAIVNQNDLTGAMRRVIADLTSYYLLGYYSTNAKPDGKFRTITVRLTRPGVEVRARRGYRAPTREEMNAPRATPATTTRVAESTAVNGILHRPDEAINPVNLASLRHVVMWKRGPSTGRAYVAVSDPHFRRTERVRVEHPTDANGEARGRLLDALGRPMKVPVEVSERIDPSGTHRWIVADVVLAPLAPGDYSIEIAVEQVAVSTTFRIVP